MKHTIQLYGGTITGNKQGGIKLLKNSTLALHGEEVDTAIALPKGSRNTDAVLGPIKITGNTGGNMIAHCDNPGNGIGITFTDFTLSGDADVLKNYTLTQPTGVTANITNGWNPVKDTEYTASIPNAKGWLKEDLTVTAKDGYELSLTNTADGTWENTLIGAVESADSSLKFYVRNKTTGAISEQVTVAYKLDKNTETTGTTGKVEFVGRSSWQTFVNHITFGLFYKDEVTVKAEADDGLSGVASIEYAVSDKAMSLEEVMAITDWTAMPKDGVCKRCACHAIFSHRPRIRPSRAMVSTHSCGICSRP